MNGQNTQQLNLDVTKYLEQKAKGVVRIIKVDGVAQYAMKRYDPDKGTPIPMLVALKLEEVQAQRQALLDVIAALDAVAADIAAATEV